MYNVQQSHFPYVFLYLFTGSCITSVVINGQQRVVVTIDKTLFPSPDIFQKLGGFIQDEIQSLIRLKPEIYHQKKDATEIV